MKTLKQQWLTRVLAVFCMIALSVGANAADRYAVASGDWGRTTTWSATLGGTSGASIPTASDNVYIIGFTVGLTKVASNTTYFCNNLTLGTSTTAGNINLGDNGPTITLTVSGNIDIINGVLQVIPVNGQRTYNMYIAGNLTVSSQGTFDMFGSELQDKCVVTFNGFPGQIISGVGTFQFVDITINDSRLSIQTPIRIEGNLSFVGGMIDLVGVKLTLDGSITGFSQTSYIITDMPGSLFQRNNITAGATLPIGTQTRYLPVIVTPNSGSVSYTARVYEGTTLDGTQSGTLISTTGNISHRVDAQWEVSALPSTQTLVQLQWTDDLEGTYFRTRPGAEIGIGEFRSGSWGLVANSAAGSQTSNFAINSILIPTTVLPIGVGVSGFLLPITLANFGAIVKGNAVQVDWKATSTSINSSFEVERSATGNGFAKLGAVNAKGVGDYNYQFVDNTPGAGANLYRLKITNEAGKVSYSKTVAVNMNAKTFSLTNTYPTVATDNITLVIGSSIQRNGELSIIDVNGRIVVANKAITINSGNLSYPVNISTLSAGNYVLLLNSGDEQLQARFIKR